ncbi:MAG TPA: BsuPI-related putative proteinase inhibitor [Bryobacteraceae bacterium]|nr:BsuPI-related putative proteinase inhibitor [Bryobacteraceae bacterium]
MKTTTAIVGFILAAGSLSAAAPEYFPLQNGSSWVYRATQGRTTPVQTIQVTGRVQVNSREYFKLEFFGREVNVRVSDDGSLYAYDSQSQQERLWLPFAATEGQTSQSEFDNCSKAATIRSKTAKVKTILGEFDNALQLTYEPSCADAGVTTQYFVPNIGLILHEETSIAGPRRYELTYSRTGSTNLEAEQLSFTMSLDAAVYDPKERSEMAVRLTLRNSRPEPIELVFPSGQSYDLRIWNWRGEVVYTWSADKLFAAVYRREPLAAGERTFSFTAPITQLPPGRYAAEGFLTTEPRTYSSVVHFEVR